MNKFIDYFKDIPPLWTPKEKGKRYKHELTVISQKDTSVGYVLNFTSESKAKTAIKAIEQADNNPIVLYDKKPLPKGPGKDGFIR